MTSQARRVRAQRTERLAIPVDRLCRICSGIDATYADELRLEHQLAGDLTTVIDDGLVCDCAEQRCRLDARLTRLAHERNGHRYAVLAGR